MLKITIPSREAFNEQTQTFVQYNEITICLEHSLVSISKWESKWHKPFLDGKKKTNEIITSELVYYWMISYGIPMDAEKWHFNRLLTLIRIFSIKESTDNKMSKKDTLRHYAALNAARRKGHKK